MKKALIIVDFQYTWRLTYNGQYNLTFKYLEYGTNSTLKLIYAIVRGYP